MSVLFRAAGGEAEVDARDGETLLGAARRAGFVLDSKCGGQGVCRGCVMRFAEGSVATEEGAFDGPAHAGRPFRSCQAQAGPGGCVVEIPPSSLIDQRGQIDDAFVLPAFALDPVLRRVRARIPAATLDSPASWAERTAEALEAVLDAEVEFDALALAEVHPGAESMDFAVHALPDGRWRVLRAAAELPGPLGLAIDIGTTTVVAALVSMEDGAVLARASRFNQQMKKAEDVVSRISLAGEDGSGVAEMKRLVVEETIAPLAAEACAEAGRDPSEILAIALAGNTVMTHLLMGASPWSIGRAPFESIARAWPAATAGALGLPGHPRAVVRVAPAISGYVGGDLSADLYGADFLARPESSLLLDIGTNGEIIYSEAGELTASATAAGPAFEGFGVTCGQRAARGAIERIRLDDNAKPTVRTIGGATATGLCGSAMIDFLAEAHRVGLVNDLGRFDRGMLDRSGREAAREPDDKYVAFELLPEHRSATGHPITISEADIASVLKAKAAIYAGMKRLLAARGREPGDVQRFVLAGGFARHIDLGNAVRIGLLPDIPLDRYEVVGNGSLAGAYLMLCERRCAPVMDAIARLPRTVELNRDPEFEDEFADALVIPNLDLGQFPTVVAAMEAEGR